MDGMDGDSGIFWKAVYRALAKTSAKSIPILKLNAYYEYKYIYIYQSTDEMGHGKQQLVQGSKRLGHGQAFEDTGIAGP